MEPGGRQERCPGCMEGLQTPAQPSSTGRCGCTAVAFTGPGQTVLRGKEVLGAILIPRPPAGLRGAFRKHGVRETMECAVVSAAVAVVKERGTIRHARVVLGAVAATPLRVPVAEALLVGRAGGPLDILAAAGEAADAAQPITDVRGSQEYRREMVRCLVRRALEEVLA